MGKFDKTMAKYGLTEQECEENLLRAIILTQFLPPHPSNKTIKAAVKADMEIRSK